MNSTRRIVVPGSERAVVHGARLTGASDPNEHIEVTLFLRPLAEPAATEKTGSLLPHERKHLTREEFETTHGANPADIAKIEAFAHQNGLTIMETHLGPRTVILSGTVHQFSQAFNVTLNTYAHGRGTYRGRTGPVELPLELEGIVQGVFGLDNRPVAKPHLRRIHDQGGAWRSARKNVSYLPTQVAKLYDFPTSATGLGETIAIIELGGGYTLNDLNTYFQQLNLKTPHITAVSVGGAHNKPTGDPNGSDGEVMLDLEVAGAVSPGANLAVYFAHNTDAGFLRAITQAIHDKTRNSSAISISWGGPEASWTAQALNAVDQAFQAAAMMGITVCAASGDNGSSDGVSDGLAHVDFPASSPHVLACGGTRLIGSGNTIRSETVWNDGASGGATGGGISEFFTLPCWQASANVPHSANPGGNVGRGLPDLAGNADPITGYLVRVDGENAIIGGTSAVAPLMAGLVALMNQNLGTRVGYLNPLLYTKASSVSGVCHDVNTGNNGDYQARAGWDPCTGLGSIDGTKLVGALKGTQAAAVATQSRGAAKARSA